MPQDTTIDHLFDLNVQRINLSMEAHVLKAKRSENNAAIGEALRRLREEAGISIREMSIQLMYTSRFLCSVELAQCLPTHEIINGYLRECARTDLVKISQARIDTLCQKEDAP